MNIGTLTATLGVDANGLYQAQKAMEAFEKSANTSISNISKKLTEMGEGMHKVGKDLSKYVSVPLTGIGVAGFAAFKNFEAEMSKIIGLVGVSKEQVNAWGAEVKTMAPLVGKSSTELAKALFFITSAGIKGAEAMSVLEMSAKAATAGLGETMVVADAVTSAMNAYGVANLSAEHAVDIMVATVREGKMAPEELAGSLGKVLPLAAQMKVSFDQVGAAMAAMTRTGFDSAAASTALRGILSSLIKPTKTAEDALRSMGTSSAELRDSLKGKGLFQTLMDLKDLTNTYGEDIMAQVVPNIRALSGVLSMMGENVEKNKGIFDRLAQSQNSLKNAFEEATTTVEFKYNQAIIRSKSIIGALGKTVAESATPIIEKFGLMIERVTKWYKGLDSGTQKLIITIGGLLAGVGPLVYGLGTFLICLGKIIPMVTSVIKVFNLLKIAMLSNPVTAIALGITTLAVAFIALYAATNKLTAAQQTLKTINDQMLESTVDQQAEINKLVTIIQSENATKEQQAAAIAKLNSISPEYLGYLTAEMVQTGQAKLAIDAYIGSLQEKAKQQAAQNVLADIEKKRIEDLAKGNDKRLSFWQNLTVSIQMATKMQGYNSTVEQIANKNAIQANEDYISSKKAALGVITDVISESKSLQKQYELTVDQMKNIGSMEKSLIPITQKRINDQIAAENQLHEDLKAQLGQRIKEDKNYQSLASQLAQATAEGATLAFRNGLQNQMDARAMFLATGIQAEADASLGRLKVLQGYAKQAEQVLLKIPYAPGKQPGASATPPPTPPGGEENPITKAIQSYKKELESISNMEKMFGDSFDETNAKLNLHSSVLQTLVKEGMKPTNPVIQELMKSIQSLTLSAMDNAEEMNTIANMEKVFGASYDELGAKINVFQNTLQSLSKNGLKPTQAELEKAIVQFQNLVDNSFGTSLKEMTADVPLLQSALESLVKLGVNPLDPALKQAVVSFTQLSGLQAATAIAEAQFTQETENMTEAMNKASNQSLLPNNIDQILLDTGVSIAYTAVQADRFKESFNKSAAQVEIYAAALKKLQDTPGPITPEQQAEIDTYIKKLKELGYTFDNAAKSSQQMSEVAKQAMQDMFVALGEGLGELIAGTGNMKSFFDKLLGVILDFAGNFGKILISIGVAKVALEKIGISGIGAIVAGVALVAAVSVAKALLAKGPKAPGMAKGGVVPAGFQNDSYPAFLTSGEHVIPPGKLPEFEKQRVDVKVTVQGVTKGQDLYYIVKEAERRYKNAY